MSHSLLSPGSHIPEYGASVKPGAVQVEGEIIQVVEQLFGGFAWRVATGESQYFGYVGDVVYVNYDGPRFLDGDIVRVVAVVDGLKTYSAIFGQQVTIPEVTAVTVELIQQVFEIP